MKKIVLGIVAVGLFLGVQAAYAECLIPPGLYHHLFSDQFQTYYFNDTATLRVDGTGLIVVQKGDFDYAVAGGRYQRQAGQFIFTNSAGQYTSDGNGPIYFMASDPTTAQIIAVLPMGSSHADANGTYIKQANGRVVYRPLRVLPPILVSGDNCNQTTVAEFQVTAPRTVEETEMEQPEAPRTGSSVVQNRYGMVATNEDGSVEVVRTLPTRGRLGRRTYAVTATNEDGSTSVATN